MTVIASVPIPSTQQELENISEIVEMCETDFSEFSPAEIRSAIETSETALGIIKTRLGSEEIDFIKQQADLERRCQILWRRLYPAAKGINVLTKNIFQSTLKFFDERTICIAARVCTSWRRWCDEDCVWSQLSDREGIPQVEGAGRNRKYDYLTLFVCTLSGRRLSPVLGDVVGRIPRISAADFNKWLQRDRYEPEKFMIQTWEFVVDPAQVTKVVSKDVPLALDDKENLIEVEPATVQTRTLTIPVDLKNIRTLSQHSSEGLEHGPVFADTSWEEVFEQCSTRIERTEVTFQRIEMPDETRNKSGADQQQLLQSHGYRMVSVRKRAISSAVHIRETGSCPDGQDPYSIVRTTDKDKVERDDRERPVGFGGFAPGAGAHVSHSYFDSGYIGAVPCVPAEV